MTRNILLEAIQTMISEFLINPKKNVLDLLIVRAAKLFNMLPIHLKANENPIAFKTMTKH